MSEKLSMSVSEAFRKARGPIEYGFTNDYIFRIIMQKNIPVLKGLIASLLHLRLEEIASVVVDTPILDGDTYNSKKFILDVEVILNNDALINLGRYSTTTIGPSAP